MKSVVKCEDGSAMMYLSRGRVALVDQEDLPILMEHSWYATKNCNRWYAEARVDGKLVHMHVFLLGRQYAGDGKQIHHMDGDGLNNRRDNLVVLTTTEHRERHPHSLWHSVFEA